MNKPAALITKPSALSKLNSDDVIELQSYYAHKYEGAPAIQVASLTEATLARLEIKDTKTRLQAVEREQENQGKRLDALEASVAPTRARLPSLSEASSASDLEALDRQAPPSLADQVQRANEGIIKSNKRQASAPVWTALFVSVALAAADVVKTWILHK